MSGDNLPIAMKISLVLFMAGNLLYMGLLLKMGDALEGIKNLKAESCR